MHEANRGVAFFHPYPLTHVLYGGEDESDVVLHKAHLGTEWWTTPYKEDKVNVVGPERLVMRLRANPHC